MDAAIELGVVVSSGAKSSTYGGALLDTGSANICSTTWHADKSAAPLVFPRGYDLFSYHATGFCSRADERDFRSERRFVVRSTDGHESGSISPARARRVRFTSQFCEVGHRTSFADTNLYSADVTILR